jgi:uncharacterized protein (TIGR02147 family)
MNRPSVFQYLDYRAFLRDIFVYRKEKESFFSHRYFAEKATFSSPNFVQLVMNGKRNLTARSVARVATGLGLGKGEREYFESLVFMNQAATHEERDHYYRKAVSVRGAGEARELEKSCYEYFSNWYCVAVREVATWSGGTQSAEEIAARLSPPISPKEAEKALRLLEEVGLLRRNSEGAWVQSEQALTTGPEVLSLLVTNFHREMLRLAAESLDRHPPEERDVTAVTVGVNARRMPEIKQKIAALRKEILSMACEDEEPGEVIQINIQAFPLTGGQTKEAAQEPLSQEEHR